MIVCDTNASVSYFWFFGHKAGELLMPQPGIEPTSFALGGEVLTTRQPGKSPIPILKVRKLRRSRLSGHFQCLHLIK